MLLRKKLNTKFWVVLGSRCYEATLIRIPCNSEKWLECLCYGRELIVSTGDCFNSRLEALQHMHRRLDCEHKATFEKFQELSKLLNEVVGEIKKCKS